jgi:hypothetical protein
MPNGYRGLAFAAFIASLFIAFGLGAYVTGLPKQQDRYQPYYSSENDIGGTTATVAGKLSSTLVQRTPCHNPKSETESDLCAQWRAAKAAERSADWTTYGFWATIAGIALLIWQLALTRKAVSDTGKATKEMIESNSIAREVARLQFRANVIVDQYYWLGNDQTGYQFGVNWKNVGSTSTKLLRTFITSEVRDQPLPEGYDFPFDESKVIAASSLAGAFPFRSVAVPQPASEAIPLELFRGSIERREVHFYIYGWAEYSDGFSDIVYVTKFCSMPASSIDGNDKPIFVFQMWPEHNGAEERQPV